MSITYTQLRQAIQDYTENDGTEFTDNIDLIIQNTELKIYRNVDLNVFRKTSTAPITAQSRFLAKPADFVVDRFLSVYADNTTIYLLSKDISFIQTFWPDVNALDTPRFYGEWDQDTLILAPTPAVALTATLGYTYRPQSIVTTGTTSWLGDNAQDALLYGCLVEAYGFQKTSDNAGDMTTWMRFFDGAVGTLRNEEENRQRTEEQRHGETRSAGRQ